jgi:hypothetical protein
MTRTLLVVALLALSPGLMAAEQAPRKPGKSLRCDEPTTGSRIRPSANKGCEAPKHVRVYSQEEIERTGRFDLADALKTLDPSFR